MTKPEAICRAALLTKGVPHAIVDGLHPGRLMDAWVQLVVINELPWQQVDALIKTIRDEIQKETH